MKPLQLNRCLSAVSPAPGLLWGLLAVLLLGASARAQVLTNASFVISSGAGQSGNGVLTSCMIMSDGTNSWSGGAVGVQGPDGLAVGNTHAEAANVTFKYFIGSFVDSMNATYGASNWTVTNAVLAVQYTLYANNNRFNGGAGSFAIYWVSNDCWSQGTTNPVYATNAAGLAPWAGSEALLASEYFPWSTPWYVGTTNDITNSSVWVTDKSGIRQSTNYYSLGLDPSFVQDITCASAGVGSTNSAVTLYLMATSERMGICIFTGGANFLPTLSFDVVPVVTPVPRVLVSPRSQTIIAGQSLDLSVIAAGQDPLSYQWYFNSNAIEGATSARYQLASVAGSDAGAYQLVVSNANGCATSSVANVTVVFAPSIVTQPASLVVSNANNAAFSVSASGTEPLAYQWYFNSNALAGAATNTVDIVGAVATNAGGYWVVISNLYGCVTSSVVSLDVEQAPPIITQPPLSLSATNGNTVVFQVAASGSEALSYQWFFNGSVLSGASGATCIIPSATTNDSGAYQVMVANAFGSVTSGVASLWVRVPPQILTQPLSRNLALGDTLSLAVSATNVLAYEWFKDGARLAGAAEAVLNIPNLSTNNAGIYYAVVTNADGTAISRAVRVGVGSSQLMGWGLNSSSQLGDGTTTTRTQPRLLATNVVTAAVSYTHSLFVAADGTLYTLGQNSYGQLGDGTTASHTNPVALGGEVVSAACGSYHSLYLKEDGTLWAMGYNYYGQLGDGTTTSRYTPILMASNVVAMAAGYAHTLYLQSDGTLWAVGYNGYGQLGDGSTTTHYSAVLAATNVAAIASGYSHSLFLKTDRSLWAMGYNYYGQLGDASTTTRVAPVCVATNVAQASGGSYHSLFIQADGTLWAMGMNSYGALGDGTLTSRSVPVLVASNVVSAAGGAYHSLFIKADGSLWAMGRNNYGQLGDGTLNNRSNAVAIPGLGLANVAAGCAAYHGFGIGLAQAPAVVASPAALAVLAGSNALFSASASGFQPLGYQWFFNGGALSGASTNSLSITNAALTNSGGYYLVVSNAAGSATSSVVALTVKLPTTLVLTSSANPCGYKAALAFMGTISPVQATGTVQFLTNGVVFDTETLTDGLASSAAWSALPVGTNLIWAVYSGDSTYWSSTNTFPQVVTNRVTAVASIRVSADGLFALSGTGVPGESCWLEAATNLVNPVWQVLSTNTSGADGLWQYRDADSTNYSQRFYRVGQP